jgi:hypothetical protein
VVVETDLNVTGRAAQFGRGILEDVSARILGEFARGLEREVLEAPQPERAAEALDLGRAAWDPLARRVGIPAAAFTLGLVIGFALRRK